MCFLTLENILELYFKCGSIHQLRFHSDCPGVDWFYCLVGSFCSQKSLPSILCSYEVLANLRLDEDEVRLV